MLVVGLTGSIGMGKSTVAAMIKEHGVAVIDADQIVHDLYRGAAVPLIERAFPGATEDGQVDRERLAAQLLAAPDKFQELEAIVHPLVREAEQKFLQDQKSEGAQLAVVEIPLLFETGAENLFDKVIVVSAECDQQRARVLSRKGMTPEKLATILERQMPDEEKRKRADFIVDTGTTMEETRQQITDILTQLQDSVATAYERHWLPRNLS